MDYFVYSLIAPAILIIMLLVLTRTWRFRANRHASILVVALLATLGWLTINYLELVVKDPDSKLIFAKGGYLFNGAFCSLWIIFALRYTRLEHHITRRRIALLLVPWATGIILAFTNDAHHLIWQSYAIVDVGFGLSALRITRYGAAFWPLMLVYYGYILIGYAILLARYLRSSPLFRNQTIWILGGVLLPVALNLIYILRIIPGFNKDYTAAGFGFAASLVVIAILRFHLFQLAPVARETLVDQMGDGMLVFDYTHRVVDNNPAAARLLDGPMRLVGSTAGQLFPGLPNFEQHLPRKTYLPVELQYQSPAGRILKLRIWGISDDDITANGWLVILEDVSASQQALTDLRKSEELFRSVVQSAQEGVAVLDLQGRFTYVSPRLVTMGNFDNAQSLLGKSVYEFVPPQDMPRAAAGLQRLITGETIREEVFEYTNDDGTSFFIEILGSLLRDPNGIPYGIALLVRDITERLSAEAERTRMAQILQTVIDNEHIILTSTDSNNQMILWNRGAEIVTGYSSAEALGNQKIFELCYPEADYRQYMAEIRRRISSGEAMNFQLELVSKDGERKHVMMYSHSLQNERGQAVGNVNLGLDVTARIRTEQDMQSLNARLEEIVTLRTLELQNTVLTLQEEIRARREAESELLATKESLANRLAEQSRQLGALYEVILTSGQSLEWRALLDALLEKIATVTLGQAIAIYQHNAQNDQMQLVAQQGIPGEIVESLQEIPANWQPQPDLAPIHGLGPCFIAPIHLRGEITGALRIWRDAARPFSLEDVAMCNALADQAGIIMENTRLRGMIRQAAAQEERQRLARDLHDSVSQSLHSLAWSADTALNRLQQNNLDKLEQSLNQIGDSARQALKEMRLLLYESMQPAAPAQGLVEAITLRLEAVEQRAGMQTLLHIGEEDSWPPAWENELLSITSEALNNVLKYARASQVQIRLSGGKDWCELEIEDNGIGFDPQRTSPGGIGLRSMHERAAALGGSIQIHSAPGKGTRVCILIGENPDSLTQTGGSK